MKVEKLTEYLTVSLIFDFDEISRYLTVLYLNNQENIEKIHWERLENIHCQDEKILRKNYHRFVGQLGHKDNMLKTATELYQLA